MKQIRAFVAHSFDDDEVVRAFLKIFQQISDSHPDFTWQNAEPFEPRLISDKVLDRFDEKNLFIGICTKKELIVPQNSLKKSLSLQGWKWWVDKSSLEWKTSDWIIQEIGLAKGRGLDLLLLVEDGLRPPGDIQGNLETIRFDRNTPEKAFGKILEGISALVPKIRTKTNEETDSQIATAQEQESSEPEHNDNWLVPKPDWKSEDYKRRFIWAKILNDEIGAAKIDTAYLETEVGMLAQNKISWIAHKEHIKVLFDKDGQLSTLESLASEHHKNSDIQSYLATCYEHYNKNKEAGETFEKAAQAAESKLDQIKYLHQAASNFIKAQDLMTAADGISRMKLLAQDLIEGEYEVLIAQCEYAEETKNDDLFLSITERLVDINPSDANLRFKLAYKYSDIGNDSLALLHYTRIPISKRNCITWNNIGVAFDRLKLPTKSIEAYRKSEEMGETLAMSNLAWKFLGTGFLPEAQKLCDTALTIKDYHKNIGGIITRLREIPEEEQSKETELLNNGKIISDFYIAFGKAMGKPNATELPSHWQGPDCTLEIFLQDGKFIATGSFERKILALPQLIGRTENTNQPLQRFQITYEGKVTGHAIEAIVSRKRETDPHNTSSGLPPLKNELKVLLTLNEDTKIIRAMEVLKEGEPRFYSWHAEVI